MVTATHQAFRPSRLLGDSHGLLTFRVRGSEHDGRILKIRSSKCVIGSHPNCTLRLRAAGIGPYHCLILRGADGVFVRRWSPDTCLNGQGFHEARLNAGDLLEIGPIQLEVLESAPVSDPGPPIAPRAESLSESEPGLITASEPSPADLQSQDQSASCDSDRPCDESQNDATTQNHDHDSQTRPCEVCQRTREELESKLATGLEQAHLESDELSQRCETLTAELKDSDAARSQLEETIRARDEADRGRQDAHQTLVDELRGELALAKENHAQQVSEQQRIVTQCETAEQTARTLRGELDASKQNLEELNRRLAESQNAGAEGSEQQEAQLQAVRTELENQEQRWKEKLGDWESTERQLRDQLQQREAELETSRAALTELQSTEQTLRDQLRESQNDLEQSRSVKTECESTARTLRDQLRVTENELEQSRASVTELEPAERKLRDDLEHAKRQEELWKEKLAEWESTERQMSQQLQQTETELETTRGRLTECESTERALRDELQQAQEVLTESRTQLIALQATVKEQTEKLAAREQGDGEIQRPLNEASSDMAQWKDSVECLQHELQQTREEHRRARDEWHIDRQNLERELATRSESVERLETKNQQDMQEAESLIQSLQREGKHLLMQLEEARQTIRNDSEKRKKLGNSDRIAGRNISKEVSRSQTVPIHVEPARDELEAVASEPTSTADSAATPASENQTLLMNASEFVNVVPPEDATDVPDAVHTVVLSADQLRADTNESAVDRVNEPKSPWAVSDRDSNDTSDDESAEDEQPQAAGGPSAEPVSDDYGLQEVPKPTTESRAEQASTSELSADGELADEEGMIQQYMERLLKRVGKTGSVPASDYSEAASRGAQAGSEPSVVYASGSVDARGSVDATAASPDTASGDSGNTVAPTPKPSPKRKRKPTPNPTPGMTADIMAMRELANSSARQAIQNSDQRRDVAAAFGELAVATVCLVTSGLVTAMSEDLLSAQAIGGNVGFAFGLIWFLRGSKTLFGAWRTRHVPTSED